MEEVKNFLPSKKESFKMQGCQCEIVPFNFDDCVRLINDFFALFEKVKELGTKTGKDFSEIELSEIFELKFITSSIDNLKNLIVACSNISSDAINQLEIKSITELALRIIEVNGMSEIIANLARAGQLLKPETAKK